MNTPSRLISVLGLSAFLTGCVGVGPNTQQGAVNGGALGALAGAIIGHNSRGGDTLGGAILGGTVGAIAGGTLGNSVDNQRGTIYGYPEPRRTYHTAEPIPPPPAVPLDAETIPPQPAANALWIPGFWSFDGVRYTWSGGRWEIPPPGATSYTAAHWENEGGRQVWVQGVWR